MRYDWVMAQAARCFRPFRAALEVGPDDGTFAEGFIQIGYRIWSVGLERRSYPWPHFPLNLETGHLPIAFDLIHAGQVLEHVDRPAAVMHHLTAMSRPDTLIILSAPDFPDPEHRRTYDEAGFYDFAAGYLNIAHRAAAFGKGRTCFQAAGFPRPAALEAL